MAIERRYQAVDPVAFTIDGQENGIVTISDTLCFKVKMAVIIKADGLGTQRFQVKRIIDSTQMILGPEKTPLHSKSDLSAYVLGLNPTIYAPEQERPAIPPADYERAVYEEEPIVAKRVYSVDKYGNPYTVDNPIPVKSDVLTPGVDYDEIDVTYPTTTQEIFTYTLSAVSVRTVTIDYTDACKEDILKVTYNEL